jgi:hypothetical protein
MLDQMIKTYEERFPRKRTGAKSPIVLAKAVAQSDTPSADLLNQTYFACKKLSDACRVCLDADVKNGKVKNKEAKDRFDMINGITVEVLKILIESEEVE